MVNISIADWTKHVQEGEHCKLIATNPENWAMQDGANDLEGEKAIRGLSAQAERETSPPTPPPLDIEAAPEGKPKQNGGIRMIIDDDDAST